MESEFHIIEVYLALILLMLVWFKLEVSYWYAGNDRSFVVRIVFKCYVVLKRLLRKR